MSASLPTRIEACFTAMEASQFTFKQNVLGYAISWERYAVFLDSHGVLLAHFQKRNENVNSASYCEVLLKLRDAIRRKLLGQLARRVLLHHDNTKHHTARTTQETVQEIIGNFLQPGLGL
jgi:hypothetical protein